MNCNTYRVGAGMAALFNEKLGEIQLQTSVQATGGSVHNMELLANKEVELATAGGSIAYAAYNNLGRSYEMRGDIPEALECYRTAVALWRGAGATREQSVALHNLGKSYLTLGMEEEALDSLGLRYPVPDEESLAMFDTYRRALSGPDGK